MQYPCGLPDAYALDDPLQNEWYPSPASNEQQHDYTENLESFITQDNPAEHTPSDYDLGRIVSQISPTNSYRHLTPISQNDDTMDSMRRLDQQGDMQPLCSTWLSPLQQETLVPMHDPELSVWGMQQQTNDATVPLQLDYELVTTTPLFAKQADHPTCYPQPVYDNACAAAHVSSVADTDAFHPHYPFGNSGVVNNPFTDFEGDDPCYAKLLYRALKEAPGHTMELKALYKWIETNSNKSKGDKNRGWRNSVRHNLSMNGAFKRIGHVPYTREASRTSWSLTDEALEHGIISTTRFRKTPKQNKERRGAPAIKRQLSGAKGGQATKKATRARQAREKILQQQHQQSLEQQQQHSQQGEHCLPSQQMYSTEHNFNAHDPLYSPTPQQHRPIAPPYFNAVSAVIPQQATPYMQMPVQTSQIPHSYAFDTLQPSQSPQRMSSSTLQDPLLYSAPPHSDHSGDYGYAEFCNDRTLLVRGSRIGEAEAVHSDEAFGFLE